MRAFKSVRQHYAPTPEIAWLFEQFRQMLNDCIRIGLAENVTGLKSLSLKAYRQLSRYDVASYHMLRLQGSRRGTITANSREGACSDLPESACLNCNQRFHDSICDAHGGRLSLAYASEAQQVQPRGFIGIDRNLDNVTVPQLMELFIDMVYPACPKGCI